MSKVRSDSVWGKLAPKQRKQLDQWFFEENLGYREVQERAEKEFGVKASRQSLSKYFRRRKREREEEEMTPEERDAQCLARMKGRAGASLNRDELEAMTMRHVAMAAYEMSLSDPKKLPVNELQRLVKLLQNQRALSLQREALSHKEKIDELALMAKVTSDHGHTKEEWEKIVTDTAKIVLGIMANARAEYARQKVSETGTGGEQDSAGAKAQNAAETVDECFAEGSEKPVAATLINANQS